MFTVIAFPTQGRADHRRVVLKHVAADGTVIVTVGPDGAFAAQTASCSGETTAEQFQRVQIEPGARILLTVIWGAAGVALEINGNALGKDPDGLSAPIVVESKPEHRVPSVTLSYPELVLHDALPDLERFFLETVIDVDSKVVHGKRYDLIRAAGALRQLLLDDLLHKVNRAYRKKISFEVLDFRSAPPLRPDIHWRIVDPFHFPGVATVNVALDQFLAIEVLRSGGNAASVRDVIKACANAKGGVHYGPASNPQEELLLDWDERFRSSNIETSVDTLRGLCRVSLSAIEPVIRAIQGTG